MKTEKIIQGRDVYIVDANRSPFLKVRGKPGAFSAADLAVNTCKILLERQPFQPSDIDELITGCMIPSSDEANISRIIGLRLGCGKHVPAWTVQRNCGSGMQAIDSAAQNIASGRHDLILAGGVEVMSRSPLLLNNKMVDWFSSFKQAKTLQQRLLQIIKLRPGFFKPVVALLGGLTDPVVGLSMGQTAENLAYRFNIPREAMDRFALMSHQRVASAQKEQRFPEITPITDTYTHAYLADDGVRADTSLQALAKLKSAYEKFGHVTAGNSSQVTDGAAFLVLASATAVKKYNLPVVAKIIDTEWTGLDPAEMGLGPVFSIASLIQRHNLKIKDIDYWEINEAFSAQILACLEALKNKDFCQKHFAMQDALGEIALDRLNVNGGAIALGHPIAASGARLVMQLMSVLKQNNAQRGIAALCIGGGQGGAMLIERVDAIKNKGE